MKQLNICIIGPLCAGKTTCIASMPDDFFASISSGKLIRAAQIDVSSGDLIDDNIVLSLIHSEMQKTKKHILHDGFPRTAAQATKFLEMEEKIDYLFYFNASYSNVLERVAKRLVCSNPNCQATYDTNIKTCPKCNSSLLSRPDDNPNAILKRYDIFVDHLKSIFDFCKSNNIPVVEIDANLKPIDVSKQLKYHLTKISQIG